MSYGVLLWFVVMVFSKGVVKVGVWLNIGEGGMFLFYFEGNCDIVYQIGIVKYGVCDVEGNLFDDCLKEVVVMLQVKMIELKFVQGVKSGKGGILFVVKVNLEIVKIWGILEG